MTGGFDAVMLSYDEPLADKLHARLQRVLGLRVKRLHGVHGMRRAYRLAAEVVDAEQFLLADGDFVIDTEFALGDVEPLSEDVSMRVWRAINPLNGLVYGYGGLKLIRRSALRELGEAVDVLAALPGRIEFAQAVAGTTRINQSPYHAWKAGFRECSMLARGSEYGMDTTDSRARIAAWTSGGTGEFADYATAGAREGVAFAAEAARDPGRFDALNDPAWLLARFTATHGEQAVAG
ncbi:hypothetical protein AMK26_22400 [Streptomyces sp. CB03234]|uniref:hypothetical protein n=1 Tax=Streptomyces sp. (strain CB03234) TaxID=1703937 RepID=UPI00093C152E|nr:hypothetical protein [Streptomyces sp. CB03234]OKK02412.1 hypothetical protein AMK26_22400 [Streptomyces sp. CB03234]